MYKEHNGIYVTLCDKTHWIIIVFTLYTSLQNHSIVWIIMYCTVATSMVYCVWQFILGCIRRQSLKATDNSDIILNQQSLKYHL